MPDLVPRAKALGVVVVENPSTFTFGELLRSTVSARRRPPSCALSFPVAGRDTAGVCH